MSKGLTLLTGIRREEHKKSLMAMSDRDLCEMVRSHFESHPVLPGEKVLKDEANQRLSLLEAADDVRQKTTQAILAAKYDPEKLNELMKDGFEPATKTPFDKDPSLFMSAFEKEEFAQKYAQTRIRETSLKEGNYYLDFRHFDPTELKRNPIDELKQNNSTVYVERVNVELQNNGAGDVYVLAELSDGGHMTVGSLPESFLKNNPMNVDQCRAELQIADFSNGNMKNLSAKVVVDTDLMSGDVLDLDENMLETLDQEFGLQQ